jgi:hypothetical protein
LSALPNEESTAVTVFVPPRELIEEMDLVVRQARALVIASREDYEEAGEFLNKVIIAGKKKVESFFRPHIQRAHAPWKALCDDLTVNLEPWETAEEAVKAKRVRFFLDDKAREDRERADRERAARALREEQQRQEAEAERQRSAAEAQRRREEAEARRLAGEVEVERQRNLAADQEMSDQARRHAELRAKEIEEATAREVAAAEAAAEQIASAGEAAAQAIEQEPVHLALPSAPAQRLGGVSQAWGVDKEHWNPVDFALWIAGNPPEGSPAWAAARDRAKYIGAPTWPLLTAEAKQQKSLFNVGGITAGPKFSGRAGK